MTKKSTWLKLSAMLMGGGLLLGNGCLASFWEGFWGTGWPTDNPWLNVAIDIIKEDIFM
ncbi:MAG: hypothetical protein KKI02_11770 [Planctomycetes bacterium]|nr:hypothetical protein [Planctomycetota bacterium]